MNEQQYERVSEIQVFYPLAWLIGVDTQDLTKVGRLLGVKSIVNEFIAYSELRDMKAGIAY